MASHDQLPDPKKPQSETAASQPKGARVMGQEHGVKGKPPVVGRDVPDESKERHTEIAVEAGHKDSEPHDRKR